MKNVISTIKGYVFNRKTTFIFALIGGLMLQSCGRLFEWQDFTNARLKASADFNRLGYIGPSYDGFDSKQEDILAGNIGVRVPVDLYRQYHTQYGQYQPRNSGGTADNPNTSAVLIPNEFDVHNLQILTGIEIIGKGGKSNFTLPTEVDVARLTYLQIPVYGIYQYQLPTKGTLYGGLGPYFAYGLGGNVNITKAGRSIDYKAFDKNGANYHHFNAGLGILGGYKLENGWSFELEYQYGLTNIDGKQFFDDAVKTRTLSLNVGYPLNKIIGAMKPKKK